MSDDLRLELEEEAYSDSETLVKRELGEWNVRVTGVSDYAPANFLLKDAENRVRGAVLAYVWGKWLHVDTFWIEDVLRRHGWGTKLLEAAHAVGREKGAEAAWLDTFSWQARPFYERLGYEVVFEMPGLPTGHSRFYMQKRPL